MGILGDGEATGGRAASRQREVLETPNLKPKVQTPYVRKSVPSHRVFRCRVGDTSPGVSGLSRRPTRALARERRGHPSQHDRCGGGRGVPSVEARHPCTQRRYLIELAVPHVVPLDLLKTQTSF